jgi:uncharacterized protein YjbI with pentapeptide repeats
MMNWAIMLLIIVVISSTAAWWFIPRWQARKLASYLNPEKIAMAEDRYRQTITTALGGVLVLLSVGVAFMQLDQSRDISIKQVEQMSKQTETEYQAQLLTKGFELLGKKKSAEHLGGIRLLQTWADSADPEDQDDKKKRTQILVDALIGFVRDQTGFKVEKEECRELKYPVMSEYFEHPKSADVESDVQVALDILVDLSKENPIKLKFRGLNLSKAKLSNGNFSGSIFSFSDLSQAEMSGTILNDVDLYCANLYKAKLIKAKLSSSDGGERLTNLLGALIIGANLSQADLRRANLNYVNLNETNLREADLRGTILEGAKLFRSKLGGAKIDQDTDIKWACFYEAQLENVDLKTAKNFQHIRLRDC